MLEKWPILSYEKGKATFETLHMWTQIVGKIKLAILPWVNHSWHVTLHITPSGLSTLNMPYKGRHFQIDFDFLDHQLKISTSKGEQRQFELAGIAVADFYKKIFDQLHELDIAVEISPIPSELPDPTPLDQDTIHATYDIEQVDAFHQALLNIQEVFLEFRCGFKGKCSPV